MQSLIDLDDLSIGLLDNIITLSKEIAANPSDFYDALKGKVLATLFYEPSTRTQMSFQTAMLRLGGRIIGFDNPSNSSVSKGESLKDTIRVVSGYSDIIALRHPLEGSALAASMCSKAPVINAGDGGHLHPTQTLTDLVTLTHEKKRLDGMSIGLCGDLKNGRTVHSLIKTMSRFRGNSFVLVSTKKLGIPQYLKDILNASGCGYEEVHSLDEAISECDVLYMTRIQKERFDSENDYKKQKGVFILDKAKLAKAKKDLCVLHPLPRVDEITTEVDDDPRAKYFIQSEYGMYARMALMIKMLENSKKEVPKFPKQTHDVVCDNPRCITNCESYLPKMYTEGGDMLECIYCAQRLLI